MLFVVVGCLFVVCCLRLAACWSLRVRGLGFVVCHCAVLLRVVYSLVFDER